MLKKIPKRIGQMTFPRQTICHLLFLGWPACCRSFQFPNCHRTKKQAPDFFSAWFFSFTTKTGLNLQVCKFSSHFFARSPTRKTKILSESNLMIKCTYIDIWVFFFTGKILNSAWNAWSLVSFIMSDPLFFHWGSTWLQCVTVAVTAIHWRLQLQVGLKQTTRWGWNEMEKHMYIYIYPQTGTFADPETHPLRGFGPLCRYRVLAFGCFFLDKVLRNGLLRYILYTCPNLWCNSCSKCYGMDCFGSYFTHVQTCDVTRVQSATEWTASVHTLHMSKPVM